MLDTLTQFWQAFTGHGILATLVLIASLIVVRWLLRRLIRRRLKVSDELKAKWQGALKNTVVAVGIVGLILIWAPQLRTFALSLTAVAVAIVIATKELILCISGSLVRASSGTFYLGDLVEFAGHTGFIVDQNLLITELREYDPESQQPTGKQIVLPNSLFLTNAVRHLNGLRPFSIRSFTLYVDSSAQPIAAIESAIKKQIETAWNNTRTQDEFEQVRRGRARYLADFEPKVQINTTNLAHIVFTVTYICHSDQRFELEAGIHREVFELIQQHAVAETEPKKTQV